MCVCVCGSGLGTTWYISSESCSGDGSLYDSKTYYEAFSFMPISLTKGETGGGGMKVHPEGESSVTVSGLGCEKPLVRARLAISLS